MGLEIVVLLVDVPSLRQLVSTLWSDLYSGLEKRTMRSIRPDQDSRLKVNFDIDKVYAFNESGILVSSPFGGSYV